MANTRFKGANSAERLILSTLSDSDMFQTRHLPGTVNDADKGVSKALLQALPVAVCATAAATAAKVGTLAPESCPDFTLVNGRVIHVYFSAANTASVPTINVAGTGAIPITYPNGDYVGAWAAGTTMDLMYISITVDNTAIERWVVVSSLPVDEVAADNMHSVTSNAVANELKRGLISSGTTSLGGNYYLYKCGHIRELYLEGFSVPNGYDGNFLNIGLDDAPRSKIYAMCDSGSGSMDITRNFSVRLDSLGNVYTYGYSAYPSAFGHFIWTV